jgi:hypothetical protein
MPSLPALVKRLFLNEQRLRWLWLGGFFVMCMAVQAFGQGCAQCLDSTRATPPSVQAAYRHAIILLGAAGATLFITGTLLLRRHR